MHALHTIEKRSIELLDLENMGEAVEILLVLHIYGIGYYLHAKLLKGATYNKVFYDMIFYDILEN